MSRSEERVRARVAGARSICEALERRVHLCAEHVPGAAALTPEFIDYLNRLPMDSPAPFGVARDQSPHAAEGFGPESAPFVTILDNGPPSNRVNFVLVGDGYREVDLPAYNIHAQNVVNNFFNQSPLDLYRPYFNVHRVDVVSNETGVDNDPVPGIMRDTAMDMGFWCNGIERLLCVNASKALMFANSAPQRDQVIAIANSTKYGGAGGTVSTFSGGNGSTLEIALHEVGHSFAKLADEYDYADGATYTGAERPEPNVSIRNAATMNSLQTKWWRWLDVPGVGAFEGAYYHQFGINRPTFNSKMRSLGQPWGPVNSEQWVINIYRTVRPIDAATPGGSHPSTTTFTVTPMQPAGQSLAVQWLVNGDEIAGATGTSFNPESLDLSGTHTLSVRVVDETPLVRDPVARATWMTQTRAWSILDAIPPRIVNAAFEVDRPQMELTFAFNENVGPSLSAADLVLDNLTTGATVPASHLGLGYDAAANTATFGFPGFGAGILPDGNYRATLPAGSVSDAAGNVLAADFAFDFFFLNGDANRDGVVNLADFNRLAANFGQSPRNFSQGDFNYDGIVNLADFNILAAKFGMSLPAVASVTRGAAGDGESAFGSAADGDDDRPADLLA